jgi:hypothetical protein
MLRAKRMHPLIARNLDLAKLIDTIERIGQAVALDPDEAALAAELAREPKLKADLLKAKGRSQAPGALQQRAIVLGVKAATTRLLDDPALGPRAKAALAALEAEGASAVEARALVSEVLLDEAFGYAEDPGEFDAAYVGETLDSLVPLAKVNADLVDDWLERWAKRGAPGEQAMRLAVGQALLDVAWAEGPAPIAPEHLDDTLEHLSQTVASSELGKAALAVRGFVEFLAEQGIVGAERARRLGQLATSASLAPADSDEEEPEEDEDEDDDEGPANG